MKVKFLHILPLMAAVMLATSCNNNDKDPVTPEPIPSTDPVVQDDGEKVIIPYTIQVGEAEKKTTKIVCSTIGTDGTLERKFSDGDLGTELAVTGDGVSGTLTLEKESGKYYFSGNLSADKDKVSALKDDKIALTGTFGTPLTETMFVSNDELSGFYNKPGNYGWLYFYVNCQVAEHTQFKGTFHYNDEGIDFVDQNIYLDIQMSPCQNKLTINGKECELYNDGHVLAAVPASAGIHLGFLEKDASEIEPGQIYTIDRRGWVDLGLSDGTLWADKNYGANEIYNFGTTHTIFDAYLRLSNVTLPTGYFSDLSDGNGTDLKRLQDECHLETGAISYISGSFSKSVIGFKVFKKKDGASATYDSETDPYIFFPYDEDMPIYWNACDIEVTSALEQECSDQETYETYYYLDNFNRPFHYFCVQYNQDNQISISNLFDEIPFGKADEDKYHLRPILRKNQKPAQAPEPPTE